MPHILSQLQGSKHKVNTEDAQPFEQSNYPVAQAVQGEIMSQVTDMITNGICRPGNSPWESRVVLRGSS